MNVQYYNIELFSIIIIEFAGPLAQGVSEHVTIAPGFGPWLLNETLFRVVGRPRAPWRGFFGASTPRRTPRSP